jgi:hypothetical protein
MKSSAFQKPSAGEHPRSEVDRESRFGVGRKSHFGKAISKGETGCCEPFACFSHELNRDLVLYDDQACDRKNRNFSLLLKFIVSSTPAHTQLPAGMSSLSLSPIRR